MSLDPFRNVHRNAKPIIWGLARHIHAITRADAGGTWIGRGWDNKSTEHATGLALDIIIAAKVGRLPTPAERRIGDILAGWLIRAADQLHIRHIIWNKKIWRRRRPHEGWQPLPGRTANSNISDWHQDHIHVYLDDGAGTVPTTPLIPAPAPTKETPMSEKRILTDADIHALAGSILSHPVTANGKRDALIQHLAENFVADAAQSRAFGTVLDRLSKISNTLEVVAAKLEEIQK